MDTGRVITIDVENGRRMALKQRKARAIPDQCGDGEAEALFDSAPRSAMKLLIYAIICVAWGQNMACTDIKVSAKT